MCELACYLVDGRHDDSDVACHSVSLGQVTLDCHLLVGVLVGVPFECDVSSFCYLTVTEETDGGLLEIII